MLDGVRHNPVLRHKLFQIDYLTTGEQPGHRLALSQKLDDEWRQRAEALRDAHARANLNVQPIGRATKTKIELDRIMSMNVCRVGGREMIYRQVENALPSKRGDEYSDAEWALDVTKVPDQRSAGALLRGNGNFAGAGA